MTSVATEVGFELMKFSKKDKDIRKQIAKDTTRYFKYTKRRRKRT